MALPRRAEPQTRQPCRNVRLDRVANRRFSRVVLGNVVVESNCLFELAHGDVDQLVALFLDHTRFLYVAVVLEAPCLVRKLHGTTEARHTVYIAKSSGKVVCRVDVFVR